MICEKQYGVQARVLSSMEKVFPTQAPCALGEKLTFLKGERGAFQIALFPDKVKRFQRLTLCPAVESDVPASIRQVGYEPVGLPYYDDGDGRYLPQGPGLYPDPLLPGVKGTFQVPTGRWSSFFVELDIGDAAAGKHAVNVRFDTQQDGAKAFATFSVTVEYEIMDAVLPEQTLIYTSWFHSDCLATYYSVPVFSEEYWRIVRAQAEAACRYGQNMILVPLFTPPLDTKVGGERPTVQTVGVKVTGDGYQFDFERFDRFIAVAREAGIRYFEMSHLFTQWGGVACPKIIAEEDGREKRIFGWDTPSTSEEYKGFLRAFLPALIQHLDECGLRGQVYFHLTDEPHGDHLAQYKALKEIVLPLLSGYPVMDAMSDYSFFSQGVTSLPVVATSALKPFLEGTRPENLWVYYCCSQGTDCLSNRYIAMPGWRTRALGLMMYRENVKGFLQWGLNFYFSCMSDHPIDPWRVADGEYAWPAGDPFVLYPGDDGEPVISQRLVCFNEALQDQRALQLLESLAGRAYVERLLEEEAGMVITFNNYPAGEEFLLRVRNRINRAIQEKTDEVNEK